MALGLSTVGLVLVVRRSPPAGPTPALRQFRQALFEEFPDLRSSVVIHLERIDQDLPREVVVSAVTMAELAAGPHATDDPHERARRQDRLQRAESTFEPLPVDSGVARAYGRVYAAVASAGRKARGRRAIDLLIAATALAAGLPLYTSNPDDFPDLVGVLEVVAVRVPG